MIWPRLALVLLALATGSSALSCPPRSTYSIEGCSLCWAELCFFPGDRVRPQQILQLSVSHACVFSARFLCASTLCDFACMIQPHVSHAMVQ